MSTKNTLPFVVSAILAASAVTQGSHAQSPVPAKSVPAETAINPKPSSVQSAPDAAELTKLLREFLDGASRNDAAMHERFWADDLIYTGSSGRRIGKADIMRDVRAESPSKPGDETTTYHAEDIRIQQYGTTAIVVFRLVGETTKGGQTEIANYLNSGTFLKRDGQWQVVNWQATKMPPSEESPKPSSG